VCRVDGPHGGGPRKEGFGHVPEQQHYRRYRRQRQAQSYLCLIDTVSGEVLEESRIATSLAAFERRFSGLEPTMRIALEARTHSPWISRLLEGCGHEVLVANARKLRLIYAEGKKTDRLDT
jgi:transposase